MAQIIDGKKIAAEIKCEVKSAAEKLLAERKIKPGLALLLAGDNPASKIYVSSKEKDCIETGINSTVLHKPVDISEEEVLDIIARWNNDTSIHGILVQLPLPCHINERKVIEAINPDKDVDGFHPVNAGRLLIGIPGFVPCTPAGIMELFKRYGINLSGKHAVVVGRSNIVGKPLASLLYQKNAAANAIVTICHTAADNISYYTRQADILIAAMGSPRAIKADDVKEGVVIIDVGTNRLEDPASPKGYKLVGDVDFDSVFEKASYITPVPGGVGLMTRAMLLVNTIIAAGGKFNEK